MHESHHPLAETRLRRAATAFIAPGAVVIGDVTLGDDASVWYGTVLRGDLEPICVGARSNVQDLTVVHVDPGYPTEIGEDVTIGHRAVIHGCTLERGCLIGMGAVILTGARVGSGALIAAGAVVREGFVVPPGALAAGVPARLIGEVDPKTRERMARGIEHYVAAAQAYRSGRVGGGPHSGR